MIKSCCILTMCKSAHKIMIMIIMIMIIISISMIRNYVLLSKRNLKLIYLEKMLKSNHILPTIRNRRKNKSGLQNKLDLVKAMFGKCPFELDTSANRFLNEQTNFELPVYINVQQWLKQQ